MYHDYNHLFEMNEETKRGNEAVDIVLWVLGIVILAVILGYLLG